LWEGGRRNIAGDMVGAIAWLHAEAAKTETREAIGERQHDGLLQSLRLRARDPRWYAVHEWTPGDDGRGHPHSHVWQLSPFLHWWALRALWTRALRHAGCPVKGWAGVDVKRVRGANDLAAELVKYMTKDLGSTAHTYAQVANLYTGRRRTQGSAGFIKLAGREPCPDCGDTHGKREVTHVREYRDPNEKAPVPAARAPDTAAA
jgi:hypothetical protein